MMLAMGTAFGLLGAILATPVAGFVSAYLDAFILKRQQPDDTLDDKIDRMVTMRAPAATEQGL
jgi:putative permease